MSEKTNGASPEPDGKDSARILGEWREILSRCVDETEKFTREKPFVGLAMAFFAGTVLSSFFRKR